MRKNGRAREVLELVGHMLHDAVEHPELYPDRLTIVLLDEEMERKVLTPQRLRLLRTLRQREVDSIKELADILKRPIESVSRDLKLLEAMVSCEWNETVGANGAGLQRNSSRSRFDTISQYPAARRRRT